MKSFVDAIRQEQHGFCIKNSLFLPFHCEIITIWIGKEMSLLATPDVISDLEDAEVLGIREGQSYTNLVFRKWSDLAKELGRHKGHIILHAAEKNADIFNKDNLFYIKIHFGEEKRDIFFELVNDPFDL